MEVLKKYNNNIIAVLLDSGAVALVTGRGIGFDLEENTQFELKKSHQLFLLAEPSKSDVQKIIDQIDVESLEISRKIVEKAREIKISHLMDSLLLQLADHISFKISLLDKNIEVPNLLMLETKTFYPKEFSVGQYGVELINQHYHTNFGEEEASYLALHIVNASIRGQETDVYKMTNFIKKMMSAIEEVLNKRIDQNTRFYDRLIVHLKFLALRLLQEELLENELVLSQLFFEQSQTEIINARKIIQQANIIAQNIFGRTLSQNEEIYLSLHVLRIS